MAAGNVDFLAIVHGQQEPGVAIGFDVFDRIDVDDEAAVNPKKLFGCSQASLMIVTIG